MATIGNRTQIRLPLSDPDAPRNAPPHVLAMVQSKAQALAVSILAGEHKLDTIGVQVGKSRSYLSRLQNGERPIPDRLVDRLCRVTGSNLLRQYIDLQKALSGQQDETQQLAAMLARVA